MLNNLLIYSDDYKNMKKRFRTIFIKFHHKSPFIHSIEISLLNEMHFTQIYKVQQIKQNLTKLTKTLKATSV